MLNPPLINPFGPDSVIADDGLTRSSVLRLSGTAVVSSMVSLFDGASLLGVTKADAKGGWSFFTGAMSEGVHTFAASATDADGNTSGVSAALTVVVDSQPSTVSVPASFVSDIDGAGNADIDGRAVVPVGSIEADSFTSKVTDAAGGIGAASNLFTLIDSGETTAHEMLLKTHLAPNEGHFPVNSIEQALGTIDDALAPTPGNFSDAVSGALQVHSLDASGSSAGGTTAFTLDSTPTAAIADNTPGFTANPSVVSQSVAEPVSNTATVIDAGTTLELTQAYSGAVSFAGAAGTLLIDHSSSFSGTITGQLANANIIDLADITAGANATISYSGNGSPGTLTVSDGTHTANIALAGNYSQSNFTAVSDGHGGTAIVDPPTYVGTGLDANGWTIITPSADTRTIYVSSSTGNDANNGLSAGSAVATLQEGLSLIRNGSADHLLLKAGDTFVDQSFGFTGISGRSGTEPILISSYGSGARPIIETPANSDAAIGTLASHGGGNNIAIIGLDFYDYTRDPSNPNFAGTNISGDHAGFDFQAPANNLLIEDSAFRFYGGNAIMGPGSGNVILRRDIIADSYSTWAHSEGLYADGIANLVLEQNLFDHNGWNASVPGAEANIYNQELYIQNTNGLPTVIGNIFTNAAAGGAQFRSGGTIIGNLFVKDPLALQVGSSETGMVASTATVTGNVILQSNDIDPSTPRGVGIILYPDTGLVQVQNNIVAHYASSQPFGAGIYINSGADNDIITNNIIYQWPVQDGAIQNNGGVGDTISANAIDQTGYLDPNRSVASYMASLGGTASLDAFLAAARNQSKSNWNPQYTADAVNNYIEAGFNITGSSGAPGSPTIASFSPDSGVVGDHITKASTLTLTGTAPANSTVNVFDGSTQIGSTTANASGAWSYTTVALTNGTHSLTATDTVSGTTSAASAALAVTVDTVAPTAPVISSNSASPANVVTLSGTAEANSTVTVFDGTTQLGTASANGSGAWSYATAALSAGNHSFTAKDMDAAGNTGATSASVNVTLSAPAPTIASFSTDSGTVGDHVTNDNTLALTGTAPANSTVNVFDGSTQIGTTTANASGAWSFTTGTLSNSTHSLTATDTVSGTTSAASAAFAVTVDTVAPTAPVISTNSVSPSNNVTLNGTAEANSTVAVFDGTTQLGTASANGSGAWTYTTAALAAGAHNLIATATDVAGNTGTGSSALNLSLTAPAINLVAQTTSWSNVAFPTQTTNFTANFDATPSQAGEDVTIGLAATNAAAWTDLAAIVRFNSTNTIDVRNGAAYGADVSVAYNAGTNYHFRMVVNLSTHTYSVYVTPQGGSEIALASNYAFRTEQATDTSLSDLAGFSTSGSASVLNFSIGALPAAPTVTSFSPDTGVVGDGITDPAVLTLTGTAVANSTVNVYDGTTLLGTATANASGAWSFVTVPLPDGLHKFTATDTVSGNTSAPSAVMNVTVDTVAPAAPTIASFSTDSGTAGDRITNDATLTLTGTAEANATVKVFDGTTLLGSVVANSSGAWTYTTAALANGAHSLTATATDVAANTGAASAALSVTIDTTAPVAPVVSSFTPDTGTVGDKITSANVLTLTGTAEANATVKVFDGTTLLGNAVANGSGAWSYTTAALANGPHSLTATATDVAGNTGAASLATVVTITAPVPPTITSFSTDSGTVGDRITNDNTLALTGTAVANSAVKVFDGSTQIGTTTANASGTWTYTTAALANGAHNLTATATDAAGNTVTSSALSVTIDTTAPVAPSIASFSTDSGTAGDGITNDNTLAVTGTAEANATVKVFDGTTLLGSAVANGSGAWSYTTAALLNGTHSLTATATDLAGNTGAASAALSVTIDRTAPAVPVIVSDAIVNTNHVMLTGTAEATSKVTVFDGGTLLGTATADGNGAWSYTTNPLSDGPHAFTATASDAAGNTSPASEIFDPIVGGTTIEASGGISLIQAGNHYYLDDNTGAVSPSLKFQGADYVPGLFGAAVVPIGAEATASGYEVAWKVMGTDQYSVWATDKNGNYTSNIIGTASGTSTTLESIESSFHQDLNGDGQIGVVPTVIESNGATSLTEIGNHFYLDDSTAAGPSLKFQGADYVPGLFGAAVVPIGAEATASGYEVAWKVMGTDQYSVWATDKNGNYTSNIVGTASGTSTTLESIESSFHQDLNGDGQIGVVPTVIESNGATSLTEIGNHFYLDDSTGAGPSLKFQGADYVPGLFGATVVPIGVEVTASGYEVAWKVMGTDQYSVWAADKNGNYTSNIIGTASGTSTTLESIESSFHQDLNGDGQIGVVLNGSSGGQTLTATGAATTLIGGPNDVLNGGAGTDTFVFPANFGSNTVNNFTPGTDALQFSQSMFATAAAVLNDAQQVGSNVVITHDPQNAVTLHNTQLSNLHASDIHIV